MTPKSSDDLAAIRELDAAEIRAWRQRTKESHWDAREVHFILYIDTLLAAVEARDETIRQVGILVERWRKEGAIKDLWHATMGIGWKTCATELEAALASGAAPETKP